MGKKGSIVLSIVISVILTSGISYFMIPYLAPAPPESDDSDVIPTGLILQSITRENSTWVSKNDQDLNWTVIPSMETSITTQGNSTIEVMFYSLMNLYIQPDLLHGNGITFNITLEIEGITNQSAIIFYQRGVVNTTYIFAEFIPSPILLRTETPTLAAGTYNIRVWWLSMGNSGGFNRLTTGTVYFENTYSLNVKEISA